ncbi:MAG: hypothetical protein F4152_08205 [Dehalococcoidia bacterium]|nr:hypothetical protein [Dehalococcoidia bacterium]
MTNERDKLPCVSRHTLVTTLLEGPDHYNGHCTCDRWSYRTDDWSDLGMKWAWHYIAASERPTDDDLVRKTVRDELEAVDNYGGDCTVCGYPVIEGRTHCRSCEPEVTGVEGDECGDNCERNCCWEDTVARRHARDAAHQTDTCPDCGNCRTCEDPESPDHEDCICGETES